MTSMFLFYNTSNILIGLVFSYEETKELVDVVSGKSTFLDALGSLVQNPAEFDGSFGM